MAWFYFVFNAFFDYIMAVMLAAFLGVVFANLAASAKLIKLTGEDILSRIFLYGSAGVFGLMFCLTFVLSKTDPDFSVLDRYKQSWCSIKAWFWPADPLLDRGGLERAITLDTGWVGSPEQVFYTVGRDLYSILTNGKGRELRFSAPSDIRQAVFSPDGKRLMLKAENQLIDFSLKDNQARTIYTFLSPADSVKKIKIQVGGIQWSPDSRKLCFFVQKTSPVSSQTQWFIHDVKSRDKKQIQLGAHQTVFLSWSRDATRLYFSRAAKKEGKYYVNWFEVSWEVPAPKFITKIIYAKRDIPDDVLMRWNIHIFYGDKRLRFESRQPFIRAQFIFSRSGRRLWVNDKKQLCYQSAYGVRYSLFGLSTLKEYQMFPPPGRENELAVQDIRWMPSDKYVLLRHYSHGLLVLYPIRRKIGILVDDKVGIFGFYPY